jgi:hypothetical protein
MQRRSMLLAVVLLSFPAWAQSTVADTRAADEAAIRKTALNYVEG